MTPPELFGAVLALFGVFLATVRGTVAAYRWAQWLATGI